jgi:hypothetical protein
MNSNGRNRNNTFAGDVLIDGDLTVTGTINGGGGGGGDVTNPMSSNLNANNYEINNVAKITSGSYPQILLSELNLQNNTIRNVNEIEVNVVYSSAGQILLNSDINANEKAIFNVSELTAGEEGSIKTSSLDLQENNIINVNTLDTDIITSSNSSISFDGKGISNLTFIGSPNGGADNIVLNGNIVSNNGNSLDGITNITGYGSGDVLHLNGDIRISNSLNLVGNNITTINNTETKGISSSTGSVAFTSILNMFNYINMDYNTIFNVGGLTTSHAGVTLNLDLVPATEGKASQVLARDPAYNPANPATHKLVWQTPSGGGGGITNPLTSDLQGAGFSIYNTNVVESKNINLMIGGSGISRANGSLALPIFWGLAQKLTLAPFYQTFNTDYITPASNLGITIDSKAPDGITDTKITLSTPTLNINNSTNLAPTQINITGNLQITNSSGYIHGNNLIVRGRNASAVPTPITIEGTTTSINSSTLNITSSTTNNFLGAVNTNFSGTVRTNTIDANSGGTISILQNLTLATGRQLRSDLVFSDGLRSYTDTTLYIAGLLPDNKTQTNIILSSPLISFNNQFGPLIPDTQVNIAGSLVFNNPASNPFIHGSNLFIRGRTPAAVATPITIEGTTTTINSSTLTIYSSLANNIGGPTDFADIATFQEKPNFISGIKSNILDTYTGNIISCLHNLTLSSGKELKTPTTTTDIIQPYTGSSLNINATDTNISNRLNVLTNRSPSIGVRTTIYKTFGPMPNVNINVVLPTPPAILNTPIANQKGTYIMPPNGFVNGDKFILTMYGNLTTVGSGSLGVYLLIGSTPAVNFGVVNVASTAQPCKFTLEIDCTVSGNNVDLSNGTALLSVERQNTSIRYSTGTIGSLVANNGLSNSINIAVAQSATQTSNFTPLSYTIEQL